jgi:hypothetical protein
MFTNSWSKILTNAQEIAQYRLVELKEKKPNKIPNAPAASLQVKVKKIGKTIRTASPPSPKVGLKKKINEGNSCSHTFTVEL